MTYYKKNFLYHLRNINGANKLFKENSQINPYDIKLFNGINFIIHDYFFQNYKANIDFSERFYRLDFSYSSAITTLEEGNKKIFFEPNFLKISRAYAESKEYFSESGSYQGVTIIIKPEKMDDEVYRLIGTNQLFNHLLTRLNHKGNFLIITSEFIEHFFDDLLNVKTLNNKQFLKLKVAELFLYLNSNHVEEAIIKTDYYPSSIIKCIIDIHDYILENLSESLELKFLSKSFNIGQTTMQRVFKKIYLQSIHQFIMNQRFYKSKKLLKDPRLSISFISNEIGYSSMSRFSSFFKNRQKITPSEYRNLYLNL